MTATVICVDFSKGCRNTRLEQDSKMKVQTILPDEFERNLEELIEKGLLTNKEATLLLQILQPLREIVPLLDEEMAEAYFSKHLPENVWEEERNKWERGVERRLLFIPGFNFQRAYAHFLLDPKEYPVTLTAIGKTGRTVLEITKPYKNSELSNVEMYFFYFLRMLRHQYRTANHKETVEEVAIQIELVQPRFKRWLISFFNFFKSTPKSET
jgi:hypothetical protein